MSLGVAVVDGDDSATASLGILREHSAVAQTRHQESKSRNDAVQGTFFLLNQKRSPIFSLHFRPSNREIARALGMGVGSIAKADPPCHPCQVGEASVQDVSCLYKAECAQAEQQMASWWCPGISRERDRRARSGPERSRQMEKSERRFLPGHIADARDRPPFHGSLLVFLFAMS